MLLFCSKKNGSFETVRVASKFIVLVYCVALALLPSSTGADIVQRRGGEPALYGEITSVDDAGVTLKSDLGVNHIVPWDRIRRVDSEENTRRVVRYMDNAVSIWRARSRVERNDTSLAEPLFERLFETYQGQTNETALVVAEGLLRCRLARGAQVLAVLPALESARLERAGITTVSYSHLPVVIDKGTSLCTYLAPYWLDSTINKNVYQSLLDYDAKDDETIAAMAELYRISLARAIGNNKDSNISKELKDNLPDNSGVILLTKLVDSLSDDSNQRRVARDWLDKREETMPDFAKAWIRFHVGLSYLNETGVIRQQRGVMNLLHLPALYADLQPYLTGVALRITADTLQSMGQTVEAQVLRDELASRYPFHPVKRAKLVSTGINKP